MPELRPRTGWTEYRALANMAADQTRGTIADTPCQGFQWVYEIHNQNIPDGLTNWSLQFQILDASQSQILVDSTLTVPILITPGGGPFPATWSIQNARIQTTVPDSFELTGGRTEQPLILPLNDGTPPVEFEMYSAWYLIPLPAGAIFKIKHHYLYSPDLTFPPVLTSVLPAGGRKRMLVDPVTQDQYLPRLQSRMLVMRTQLYDGPAGPRTGLAVSYANGVATVAPGAAVLGFEAVTAGAALTADVPATGTWYLHLVPTAAKGIELVVAERADHGPPLREDGTAARGAWCVGRVTNGALVRCSGVLIDDEVDEVGAVGRREDGTVVMRYDKGTAEDVEAVSYDRGVTWE